MSKRCDLPGCNRSARKRFCSNKHKDKWHNRYGRIEERRKHSGEFDPDDDMHPFDSYSIGQD